MHNYEAVLREIIYFNRKPAYYLNRAFKLTCSELNGRFVSNDYIQTLTVIHPKSDAPTSVLAGQSQSSSSASIVSSSDQVVVGGPEEIAGQLAASSPVTPPAPSSAGGPSSSQQQEPVAHLQAHDHKVEFKEARIKSAGFLDGGLIDASDALGRTSASTFSLCRSGMVIFFFQHPIDRFTILSNRSIHHAPHI